jgi:hypothetical protein
MDKLCTRYADFGCYKDLYLLSSDEFKACLFALRDFPLKLRDEVFRSNITFPNIVFGIVPDGMKAAAFHDLLMFKGLFYHTITAGPLLPIVQESWDGSQVADWLIQAIIVGESKRSFISKNLDGHRFLQGQVHNVLTEYEIREVNLWLQSRAISPIRACLEYVPAFS